MNAIKCLKVSGGIIALSDLTGINISDINKNDISIKLVNYGLIVNIKDIKIFVPESYIDYIVNNRKITLYSMGPDKYIEDPVISVELSKDSLIEARGIYNFWKKEGKIENEKETIKTETN